MKTMGTVAVALWQGRRDRDRDDDYARRLLPAGTNITAESLATVLLRYDNEHGSKW
jgi:hypothetical protein